MIDRNLNLNRNRNTETETKIGTETETEIPKVTDHYILYVKKKLRGGTWSFAYGGGGRGGGPGGRGAPQKTLVIKIEKNTEIGEALGVITTPEKNSIISRQ